MVLGLVSSVHVLMFLSVMARRKRLRKGNKKRRKAAKRGLSGGQSTLMTVRSRQLGLPDRFCTVLTDYVELAPNWSAAAAVTHRYKATGLVGWDPAGGAGRPAYFAELAAIYASYRVTSSRIRVSVSAGSTGIIPVKCVVVPLNADPGASPFSNFISAAVLPYAKSKVVGAYGSQQTVVSNRITTAKMFGSNMVLYDDNFASLTSTDPVNNFWWGVVFYQNTTFTATAPYWYSIQIWSDVEFYDRKFVDTAISVPENQVSVYSNNDGSVLYVPAEEYLEKQKPASVEVLTVATSPVLSDCPCCHRSL